jgi:hypothetical protein
MRMVIKEQIKNEEEKTHKARQTRLLN